MLYAFEKSFVDLRPPLPPGPEWASKAAMQNVKTALVNFRADMGQVVRNLATQSDDIVMSVTRLVGPGFATNTLACPPDWDYVAPRNVDQPMVGETGGSAAR